MHKHDVHSTSKHDHGLHGRIKGISLANTLVGTGELVAGIAGGNSTLTMAGIHDIADGGLYQIKYLAAREHDPVFKRRLRRIGAGALMGATLTFGAYEIHQSLSDEHRAPSVTTVGIGAVAAAANIGAAFALHRHRDHEDAQDSRMHVLGVDVPGALTTLTILPFTLKYPELDTVGTAIHMSLATAIGIKTWRSVASETDAGNRHESTQDKTGEVSGP